jgi:hypothetical protein
LNRAAPVNGPAVSSFKSAGFVLSSRAAKPFQHRARSVNQAYFIVAPSSFSEIETGPEADFLSEARRYDIDFDHRR